MKRDDHAAVISGCKIDDEGIELPDQETARQKAVALIREAVADMARQGIPVIDQVMVIRDEQGGSVETILFRDVMLQS